MTARIHRATMKQRLDHAVALVDEYAELAAVIDNGDLMALIFQICVVLGAELPSTAQPPAPIPENDDQLPLFEEGPR